MTFPTDYYAARSAIAQAAAAYPRATHTHKGLTAAQSKRLSAPNFMTDERIAFIYVGPFMVEVATGMFLQDRLVGLTAFRLGGERDGDDDFCACVYTAEEMAAHLAKLAEA